MRQKAICLEKKTTIFQLLIDWLSNMHETAYWLLDSSKNKNIKKVYTKLIEHKLMLGLGNFYAFRPLMDMQIPTDPGVIRISFVHYTNADEIEQLITGLKDALS